MAKRFTDTDKWKKPFIRKLPTKYKLLWLYIIDECNHAGIWQVDFPVAEIRAGEVFDENIAIEMFGNKITVFDDGEKWFIPSFIEFQYGELKTTNRAHESVISILSKHNLLNSNKPLTSPLQGAKDKEKDKDMDMDMDKEYVRPCDFLKQNEIEFEQLHMKSGITDFYDCLEQWSLSIEGSDFKYSDEQHEDYRKLKARFQKWINSWRTNKTEKDKPKPEKIPESVRLGKAKLVEVNGQMLVKPLNWQP